MIGRRYSQFSGVDCQSEVPLFGGVRTEIADLVDRNMDDKLRRAEQISTWLREQGPVTQNEAEQLLWDKLALHSRRFFSQVVCQRNVRCALDYLVRTGNLYMKFQDHSEFRTFV